MRWYDTPTELPPYVDGFGRAYNTWTGVEVEPAAPDLLSALLAQVIELRCPGCDRITGYVHRDFADLRSWVATCTPCWMRTHRRTARATLDLLCAMSYPCCGGLFAHKMDCPTQMFPERPAWHSIVDGIWP
jgi:hypothetical protein